MLLTRRAIDELTPLIRSQSALIPAELLVRAVQRSIRRSIGRQSTECTTALRDILRAICI